MNTPASDPSAPDPGAPGSPAPAADTHAQAVRARTWLSRSFESVLAQLDAPGRDETTAFDYDVIVVGSGYGGAVAACDLSSPERPGGALRVCVLERGAEYLPGAFPSRGSELPGHVRFNTARSTRPRGVRTGLFDLRLGDDVCALVASGVGGGSLINAGVMAWPTAPVWADERWPRALREPCGHAELDTLRGRAERDLGSCDDAGRPNTLAGGTEAAPSKYVVMQRLAGKSRFEPAAVTVALHDGAKSSAGTPLAKCVRCGDCATGCNHGAKDSLDVNLLARARRAGAEILTGATVLRVAKASGGSGWRTHVVHTDEALRRRQGEPFALRSRYLVLAAGTFGSTEILLRSRSAGLALSDALGSRFSVNGDLIAAAHAMRAPADALGDERRDPTGPAGATVGPTITGIVDLRDASGGADGSGADDVVIEDLAVPGPLRRLFEEVVTTTSALHALGTSDDSGHGALAARDPAAIDPQRMRHSLALALIARDPADGRLELVRDRGGAPADRADRDGAVRVCWPRLRHHPPFARHHETLRRRLAASGLGGELLPNPMWRALPDSMRYLADSSPGALFTVHPLGGCPMGDGMRDGVVDDCGRVYDAAGGGVHDGLVVLDGSIVPVSLGINPALTIAVLARRAVRRLGWTPAQAKLPTASLSTASPVAPLATQRPVFRVPRPIEQPTPTRVELCERLGGWIRTRNAAGQPLRWYAEITLRFEPVDLDVLSGACGPTALRIARDAPDAGRLRLFRFDPTRQLAEPRDSDAAVVAELRGTLRVLRREPSGPLQRRLRALPAWLVNRGLRDAVLEAIDRLGRTRRGDGDGGEAGKDGKDTKDSDRCVGSGGNDHGRGHGAARRGGGPVPGAVSPPGAAAGWMEEVASRVRDAWALASRAGAARRFEYALEVVRVEQVDGRPWSGPHPLDGRPIRGVKRLVYGRRANPWRQLTRMTLAEFPNLDASIGAQVLALDTGFLTRRGAPLLRIVSQQDQPAALVDLASFALYGLRILLDGHAWSFRAPDAPRAACTRIDRLPRKEALPGLLPAPRIREGPRPDPQPGQVRRGYRLTRYAGREIGRAHV